MMIQKVLAIFIALALFLSLVSCSAIQSVPNSSNSPNEEGLMKEGLTSESRKTEGLAFDDIKVEGLGAERLVRTKLEKEGSISEVKSITIRVAKSGNGYYDKNDFYGYEYVDTGAIMDKLAVGGGVLVVRAVLQKVGVLEPIECLLITTLNGTILSGVSGVLSGASATIDSSGKISISISIISAIVDAILATVVSIPAITPGGITMVFGLLSLGITYTNSTSVIYSSVKELISTPNQDIDWNDINWDKLGYTTVKETAESVADGFMFAALADILPA